ncbi:MAG: hypothetical protein NTW21_00930, partial [Verrucomicrobia bacterium]|nr:hypothetical protein [Verrucomicrobiota bacterium]
MNRDDYSQRQKTRDADYERQYRAWVKSLPADQRRELEAQGLAEPDVARHGNGSAKGDAADSPLMRQGDDPKFGNRNRGCYYSGSKEFMAESLMAESFFKSLEGDSSLVGLSACGCAQTGVDPMTF